MFRSRGRNGSGQTLEWNIFFCIFGKRRFWSTCSRILPDDSKICFAYSFGCVTVIDKRVWNLMLLCLGLNVLSYCDSVGIKGKVVREKHKQKTSLKSFYTHARRFSYICGIVLILCSDLPRGLKSGTIYH